MLPFFSPGGKKFLSRGRCARAARAVGGETGGRPPGERRRAPAGGGGPVDERVADLLERMTLEEKVAQTEGLWKRTSQIQQPDGRFNPAAAATVLAHGIGEIARPSEIANPLAGTPSVRTPRQHAEFVNALQKWVIEHTRLGIPVMFHEEALHGPGRAGRHPLPCADRARPAPGIRRSSSACSRLSRARRVPEARSTSCRLSWISRAIRGGAASRKPTARIRTSSRGSAWRPCAAIRAGACRSRRTRSLRR